ncbi:MAG: ergothioneine biosynthesis protein EgtB [Candidatus Zixiibacteriota bacterium]
MNRDELIKAFVRTRQLSESLCKPLETEDYVMQTCDDVSPPNWHLGHTTWFFERVILNEFVPGYTPHHDQYYYIFNSYYESFGPRNDRVKRGTLSRPTVRDVYAYRQVIDRRMGDLLETIGDDQWATIAELTTLGINHEQQHQELLMMDIKHIFASNPMLPAYQTRPASPDAATPRFAPARFIDFEGGIIEIGTNADGFSYDNERPRHRILLQDYQLMSRLVTNGEFLEFIKDGGYRDARVWLSDGWAAVKERGWTAPLYWEERDGEWHEMTLNGLQKLDLNQPVVHVSYYEADAYARWADKRLPTEGEWEHAVMVQDANPCNGNFLDDMMLHPAADSLAESPRSGVVRQLFGDVWEWTGSAYLAYPGYKQDPGPLGEYNGKFMSNQMVLRGGCCVTPREHIRTSYRNFFQCDKRWPFSGFRLADGR